MKKTFAFDLITLILLASFVVFILVSCWNSPSDTEVSGVPEEQMNSEALANGDYDISLPSRPDNSSKSESSEVVISSEAPVSSEESVSSEGPASSEEPVSSEGPASSEEPVSNQEPVSSDEPIHSEEQSKPDISDVPDISMADALFIGDSRTVGLAEYSGLTEADYFATVGMSIYNYSDNTVDIDGVGKVTLDELLDRKQYGKIYIMLGINEVGYYIPTTAAKYGELVDKIKIKQPDAIIFIQANLHVSQNRDAQNIYEVNNKRISELNAELAKHADYDRVFYLDANARFDDENGHLNSETTGDGVHLYAKYYSFWMDWIVRQTAVIIDWRS